MKILVTGVKGQLGYDVCRVLSARKIEHRGIDIEELDLTDRAAVEAYLQSYRPDGVIHCAAYTAVDLAESNPDACFAVNGTAAEYLAAACAQAGAKMIYISTDYVFSGEGTHFHPVDEPTAPLSVYGKSKAAGEEAVRRLLDAHFIVRISWLFGVNGKNFVRTMISLSKTRDTLSVVDDQIGSPTYSYDLAHLLCDMIVTDRYGTYHASGEGVCSWAEFAAEIMRLCRRNTAVKPIPTCDYPTPATRPKNSRLDKSRLTQNGFALLPHWKDALARYLDEIQNEI